MGSYVRFPKKREDNAGKKKKKTELILLKGEFCGYYKKGRFSHLPAILFNMNTCLTNFIFNVLPLNQSLRAPVLSKPLNHIGALLK